MTIGTNLPASATPAAHLHPSSGQAAEPAPGSPLQKLGKAAQEFEGILLSSWLEEAQKSSLDPDGAGQDAGSETLRSLGNQAVAQALAQRGGVGIAQMIVRHFTPILRQQAVTSPKAS